MLTDSSAQDGLIPVDEPYLRLYRVKSINVYPYEDVQSATFVDPAERLRLTAEIHGAVSYRCYLRHPDRFVAIAPIERLSDSWEGAYGPEISPFQLLPGQPLAYQIEYVLFESWRSTDNERLDGMVKLIKSGALDLGACPPDSVPHDPSPTLTTRATPGIRYGWNGSSRRTELPRRSM